MSDTAPPPIGHNSGADPDLILMLSPALVRDQLELDYAHLVQRRDELLAGVDRFFQAVKKIETEDEQAQASDFAAQLRLLSKDVEAARVGEVKPLDDAKKVHQKFFKAEILDKVDGALGDMNPLLTAYAVAKENAAKAAIEAERLRLQAEADAAAVKAMESQRPSLFEEAAVKQRAAEAGPKIVQAPSTTRGQASSVGLRKRWTFAVNDLSLVPVRYLKVDEAALQAAVDGGLRSCPGVEIFEDKRAVVRS